MLNIKFLGSDLMSFISFNSLNELYIRLLPALRSKKKDMQTLKYTFVTEEDIWQYLCENIWANKKDLALCDMVDDILNTDSLTIYQAIRRKDIINGENKDKNK